ncbi:sulfate ABC transporter permease subunit CysT [Salinicola corii]|uniref:Sulfate transport system permease protein CysT n=1 Tax=Salinicola corii TaxID=2606937 RepID=A0A640WAI5_9GAMM|nr:sulfate ABC transporter permease subunit CysT [Salinicola corii]KAA0017483.1 sulfate ABC transporter permease subunit CysT [Salinicola corii]MAM57396.1 sulfate ABC transporter permease subunit CysT [Salinicola sp.]
MSQRRSLLPGFGLSLGVTVFTVSLLVLIPLLALVTKSAELSLGELWHTLADRRVLAAFRVSFSTAFAAAFLNLFLGLIVAWVLVRYPLPLKRAWDSLIDLPFALPTAVAGIVLTTLYSPNGWLGQFFAELGIRVAFTPLGITIALIFIGLPFVVRTVEPVLQDLDRQQEEASTSLGASRWQTFRRVLLPPLVPALLTGFSLAFARGLGEYGSVIFIAGNMPMKSEIVPLLIVTKLEQYNYPGATVIALASLVVAFVMLLIINGLQQWTRQRTGRD